MRCRLCSRNALILRTLRSRLMRVCSLFVRPAYCASCHTEFWVRGPVFFGPNIPPSSESVREIDLDSIEDNPQPKRSVEDIATGLERELGDDELRQLADRLRLQNSTNHA